MKVNVNMDDEEKNLKDDSNNQKNTKNRKTKSKGHSAIKWVIIITIVSLVLSFCFSLATEVTLKNSGLVVSLIILILLIAISILFDCFGVAITSADAMPFSAMAAKKVKGSKHALNIIRNADKFSSIFNDVVGDVCGIVSGACGASVALLISRSLGSEMWVSIICASIISALTIGGKAAMKRIAITNSTKIVLFIGKFISFFKKETK